MSGFLKNRSLKAALCLFLSAGLLVSCGKDPSSEQKNADPADAAPAAAENASVPEEEEPDPAESTPDLSESPSDPAASFDKSEETPASDEDPYADFLPVIRFAVCSDIHIGSAECREAGRFADMLDTLYRYCDGQEYPALDAVVTVGDMTNFGYEFEYEIFKGIADAHLREGTRLITMMGNHEHLGGVPENYTACMDPEMNKHIVLNGFHFLAMSPDEGRNDYSKATQEWLKTELADAAADAPEKPIFTFQHHHLKDTVYVSKSWYTPTTPMLKRIYSAYPQVVNFSGDSHGPMNHPLAIWQGQYTALNTGTLSYFEMEVGMTDGTLPKGKENAAQFYIVEADADNRVRIRPYNLLTGDFFRTPSNTDDPGAQLVYSIDRPSDPSSFRYTEERGKTAAKPYFAENAAVSVTDVEISRATVTVPQAFDDSCIYSYTLELTGDNGQTSEYRYFSEYYFEPMPETVSYTVGGLRPSTRYTASVTPVNAWGVEGDPITAEFVTEAYTPTPYASANPVNFYGTFTNFDSLKRLNRSGENNAYGGKIEGDVFGGQWDGAEQYRDVTMTLRDGAGYGGSQALGITSTAASHANRAVYVFATDQNRNTTKYEDVQYLRVWADFTGIDFRKACFGLVTPEGELYSTDDVDGRSDQRFYYLPDSAGDPNGSNGWQTFTHGADGCFGAAQDSSVAGLKGWFAFPVSDFGARDGSGLRFEGYEISGVYLYWDLADDSMLGTEFYLDEIALVGDYQQFDPFPQN